MVYLVPCVRERSRSGTPRSAGPRTQARPRDRAYHAYRVSVCGAVHSELLGFLCPKELVTTFIKSVLYNVHRPPPECRDERGQRRMTCVTRVHTVKPYQSPNFATNFVHVTVPTSYHGLNSGRPMPTDCPASAVWSNFTKAVREAHRCRHASASRARYLQNVWPSVDRGVT